MSGKTECKGRFGHTQDAKGGEHITVCAPLAMGQPVRGECYLDLTTGHQGTQVGWMHCYIAEVPCYLRVTCMQYHVHSKRMKLLFMYTYRMPPVDQWMGT